MKIGISLLVGLVAFSAFAESNPNIKKDLVYKTVGETQVLLDIYYPAVKKFDKAPVLYFTHGGGWAAGSKEIKRGSLKNLFEQLNAEGVVCVSAAYRLAKDPIVMRDCVIDAKDGLRYLAKNADDLGLDMTKVVTLGNSAGGHISLMLTYTAPDDFQGDPELAKHPVQVVAGINWYGPSDFTVSDLFIPAHEPDYKGADRFGGRIHKKVHGHLGYADADDEIKAAMREMSPVYYLNKNSPPMLTMHGTKDTTIPYKHSPHLKKKADEVGAKVILMEVKDAGHGWNDKGHTPKAATLIQRCAEFIFEQVGLGYTRFPIWPAGTEKVKSNVGVEIPPRKSELTKHVFDPDVTVFKAEQPNGKAIVICPGGGYSVLSTENEGSNVAKKLSEHGITAFVLRYRLPNTKDADFKFPIPLCDALRAIQWVRYHAKDYGIDPNQIGIMGFSAGGHLAASASTLYGQFAFGDDEISKVDDKPNFASLGYPVISTANGVKHGCVTAPLPADASDEIRALMSVDKNVTKNNPPTFFFHAKDDGGVVPENSILMHEALKANGVRTELKLYEKGGHGFGLGRAGTDSVNWFESFMNWLDLL